MDLGSLLWLTGIGLASGFLAGFLGIGGGVVVIPALLYGAGLSIKLATGISAVEALFATLSGLVGHRRNRTVNPRLGLAVGLSGITGALIGGVGSALLSGRMLLTLYLILVGLSIVLMFTSRRMDSSSSFKVNLWSAIPVGLVVGTVSGLLGVGGGFLLIPLMISVLRVPTKAAVGTALLVIIMTTSGSATGKIASGQFSFELGWPVVVFGVVGAQLGAKVHGRVSPRVLRLSLILLLVGLFLRTGFDLLTGSSALE